MLKGYGMHPLRYLSRLFAYLWASPYTLLGLLFGLLLWGKFQWVTGAIEIHGPRIAWVLKRLPVSAAAITLGHSVLGQTARDLEWTRDHERIHVRQFERWGVLMGPAYVLTSIYLMLRGRDFYRENPFEIEAFTKAPFRAEKSNKE